MQPTEFPAPHEIMMSVPESNAIMQLVLQFMRNQAAQTTKMEERFIATDLLLQDVRERLIKMEVVDHAANAMATQNRLAAMEARLKVLEEQGIERRGMQKLLDWTIKYGWVILAAVVLAVAWIAEKPVK